MGRIKSENFSERINTFVVFNHCLANPARLTILEYLLSRKSGTLSHIIQAVNLGDEAIRKHLKDLVGTGFVRMNIVRGVPLYCANYPVFLNWFKMIKHMYSQFMDLEDGHPGQPFDISKADLSLWDEEMEEIRAQQHSQDQQ